MEQTIALQPKWSLGTLITFRFFFVYFIFYVAPFPLGWIPYSGILSQPLYTLSVTLTEAAGNALLGNESFSLPKNQGSGDAMYNYVQFFLYLGLAVVITIGWSTLDRKRLQYETLLYWLMILLRYYLAFTMLGYGFAKIFRTQFPFPSIDRLGQSYGESSPMGLLWTFMGFSPGYNIFTGLGEAVGGCLLLFKRTRLLGAVIVAIVMSHVVMLNFAYDVPVKLFSLHLLAMAVFLTAPDMRRLVNLFILNKVVEPVPVKPVFYDTKTRWAYLAGKTLLLLIIIIPMIMSHREQQLELQTYISKIRSDQSIQGQYEVETFIMNHDTVPPGISDTQRWKKIMISGKKIDIQNMDGVSIAWHFLENIHYRRMMMFSPDLSTTGNFTFVADSTLLTMEGVLHRDTLRIISRKTSGSTYLLVDRGFHWVNEYPFNR